MKNTINYQQYIKASWKNLAFKEKLFVTTLGTILLASGVFLSLFILMFALILTTTFSIKALMEKRINKY
ncbi:hypothetical protein [Ostreibacterium oceani]|uniref:Uncharacterized protein n=1 Tax=Ostreibacterium oceani TaxID=2654998 RepID=A0A6N7EUY7_9GAMM|nr:hypothetical protein [Ostreibacterium oceani]MPV85249.1 hypothetical protein [Ostreibacterium oceani]